MDANDLLILTIEELRQQAAVDFEDTATDNQLAAAGRAAEQAVILETRRTVEELTVRGYKERTGISVERMEDVPDGVAWFPEMLKQAMLLLACELFTRREINSEKALYRVKTYDIMTKPYRRLV